MSLTGAGVLPFAYFNNTIYFLLGREHKESGWNGSDKLSDFGGAVEAKHKSLQTLTNAGGTADDYAKYTAATEFWEETMGLFLTKQQTFDMLKSQKNLVVNSGNYGEHLLKIDYNPFWVDLFKNAYNYVLSCSVPHPTKQGMMYIPSCPEGFTEKTEIKWVSYLELKAISDGKSSSAEYRPDFMGSVKKIFDAPEFAALLKEASIFKNPDQIGFVAPVQNQPILPAIVYQWPKFYPAKDEIPKILQDLTEFSLKNIYGMVLASLPILYDEPKLAQMLATIDDYNKYFMETMEYLYVKAYPNADISKPINMPSLYWVNNYCPLADTNSSSTTLGSGANGITYLINTKKISVCCNKPIEFIVKVLQSASVNLKELADMKLQCKNVTTIVDELVPSKKSDIFVTEVGSLAVVNQLLVKDICYNFPHFFGTALCNTNNSMYMYMEKINSTFKTVQVSNADIAGLLFQGCAAIYAMYYVKLVHGDINAENLAINSLLVPKRPIYKYNKDSYLIGSQASKILYFIDFGMGFIKDKLEPAERLKKDEQRVQNNVSWDENSAVSFFNVIKGPAANAYKGYYVPAKQEKAAYLRRHLLDLYLLFSTFESSYGIAAMSSYSNLKNYIYELFSNVAYHAKKGETMEKIWTEIFIRLVNGSSGVTSIKNDDLKKLNPNDLMFLGNIGGIL